jgi:hypothetical protein
MNSNNFFIRPDPHETTKAERPAGGHHGRDVLRTVDSAGRGGGGGHLFFPCTAAVDRGNLKMGPVASLCHTHAWPRHATVAHASPPISVSVGLRASWAGRRSPYAMPMRRRRAMQ